jgi:hypothetical protein
MDTTLTTHLAFGVLPGIDPQHTAASMRRVITDIAPALKARSPHRRWKTEGE